jgi:hypothetical protein
MEPAGPQGGVEGVREALLRPESDEPIEVGMEKDPEESQDHEHQG